MFLFFVFVHAICSIQRKAEEKKQRAQDKAKLDQLKKESLPNAINKINSIVDPTSVYEISFSIE